MWSLAAQIDARKMPQRLAVVGRLAAHGYGIEQLVEQLVRLAIGRRYAYEPWIFQNTKNNQ